MHILRSFLDEYQLLENEGDPSSTEIPLFCRWESPGSGYLSRTIVKRWPLPSTSHTILLCSCCMYNSVCLSLSISTNSTCCSPVVDQKSQCHLPLKQLHLNLTGTWDAQMIVHFELKAAVGIHTPGTFIPTVSSTSGRAMAGLFRYLIPGAAGMSRSSMAESGAPQQSWRELRRVVGASIEKGFSWSTVLLRSLVLRFAVIMNMQGGSPDLGKIPGVQ